MAESWRWVSADYLWWLLILPVFLVLAVIMKRRAEVITKKAFGEKITPFLSASFAPGKAKYRIVFELFVLFFILLAMARPQSFDGKQKINKEGIEVVFLFDVSNSMDSEDVKPSRLQVAKSEIIRFVRMSPNHRYGIVAFAGSAVLVSPLTTDPGAVEMYLESLYPNSVSNQGTNFKKAFQAGVGAFARGGVESDGFESGVTKAIIVVSDGEDHESAALEEVEKLVKKGVRIFTLAVGTSKGAPVPIFDQFGQRRGFREDRSGKTVMSSVNVDFLKLLAKKGEGSFHQLEIGGAAIQSLSAEILQLDASTFGEGEIVKFAEQYQIFLVLAFIFAILEFVIGNRRIRHRIWKGRFEVMAS